MVLIDESPRRGRLIVILPESMAGNFELGRIINKLAARSSKDVLYFALMEGTENTLDIARRLTTMKAITSTNIIRAGSLQVSSPRWIEKFREIFKPGDTALCNAEQTIRVGVFTFLQISECIYSILDEPTITLEGFYTPRRALLKKWLNAMVFWAGALVILGVISFLEVEANLMIIGPANKLILASLILLELGAVWIWNETAGYR